MLSPHCSGRPTYSGLTSPLHSYSAAWNEPPPTQEENTWLKVGMQPANYLFLIMKMSLSTSQLNPLPRAQSTKKSLGG